MGESDKSNEVSVTVGSSGELAVSIYIRNMLMPNTYTKIYVNVTYGGEPVSGAYVVLSSSKGAFYSGSGYTNSGGCYIDTYIAPQDYSGTVEITAQVDAKDYGKKSESVTIGIEEIGRPYLTATAGDGWIKLSWSSVSGVDYYKVYKGTSPGGENEVIFPDPSTSTHLNITWNIQNGVTYYFYVRAVVNGVDGPASNEVSVTPQKVDNFQIRVYGHTTVSNQGTTPYSVNVISASTGEPIEGAHVNISALHGTVTPSQGLTDEGGSFLFTYMPNNGYEGTDNIVITVTKPAFNDAQKMININVISDYNIDVHWTYYTSTELKGTVDKDPKYIDPGEKMVISGVVYKNGALASGVTVNIKATAGDVDSSVVTDSSGKFRVIWTAPNTETDAVINISVGNIYRDIYLIVLRDVVNMKVYVEWATSIPDLPTVPAKNVEVHVFDEYGNEHVATTDSEGYANFTDFPVGHVEGYAVKGSIKSSYLSGRVYKIEGVIALHFILETGEAPAIYDDHDYSYNLKVGIGKRFRVGNDWWNPFDDNVVRSGDWIEIDNVYVANLFNDRTTAFTFHRYGIGDNPDNYQYEAGWRIKSLYVADSSGRYVPVSEYVVKIPFHDWYYFDAYTTDDFQNAFSRYLNYAGWESYAQQYLNTYAYAGIVSMTEPDFLFGNSALTLFSLKIKIPDDYPLPAGTLTVHIEIETCEFISGSWSANVDGYINVRFTVPNPQFSYIFGDPPFSIVVKDDKGRTVDSQHNDIPGSSYWDSDGVILIRLPTGKYKYTLTGTENGKYLLMVGLFDNGTYTTANYTGTIKKGEKLTGEATLTAQSFKVSSPTPQKKQSSLLDALLNPIAFIIIGIIILAIIVIFVVRKGGKNADINKTRNKQNKQSMYPNKSASFGGRVENKSSQPSQGQAYTIAVACPYCSSVYNVPLSMRGQVIRCTHCGRDFRIP